METARFLFLQPPLQSPIPVKNVLEQIEPTLTIPTPKRCLDIFVEMQWCRMVVLFGDYTQDGRKSEPILSPAFPLIWARSRLEMQ